MADKQKSEVFFGPDHIAYVRPIRAAGTEKAEQKEKPPRKPRTIEESMKVLEPYKPSEKELELLRWAKENLEPVVAAEVHGIIYRSVKGFHIASAKDEVRIRTKALDLGVGLPEYRK